MERQSIHTKINALIAIAVILFLSLIVIPRLLAAGQKAKENNLKIFLYNMRDAIQIYQDDMDDYPAKLDHIAITKAPPKGALGGQGIVLDEQGFQGPYLKEIPHDPFMGDVVWDYTPETGEVHSNSKLVALDGSTYSSW